MIQQKKVVVGLSGGVDSSVAAALLVRQGYAVIGVMLKLWSEPGEEASNRCCTPDSMAMARRIAAQLEIPFYVLDVKEVFRQKVVETFISGYTSGRTPNPCLVCNRFIRWGFLMDYAESIHAVSFATGHYARLVKSNSGSIELWKANDANKDQSYVLSVLTQDQLARTLLPLGEMTKPEVRQLAREFDLPVADKAESQDLCFLGGNDYRDFLNRHQPEINQPGEIYNIQGQRLGFHRGLPFYTIGQRKGLLIAAPEPLYVIDKDIDKNSLIVGTQHQLGKQHLVAKNVNWISGKAPEGSFRAQVKIRYRAADAPAVVDGRTDGSLHIAFDEKMRDITPGQAAVIYQDGLCLGSGMIDSAY
jgi:tRNA-uridine 2-sulfurtransferase